MVDRGMSVVRRAVTGDSECAWVDEVWKVIGGMEKGKAPGVSGLRLEHLLELGTKGASRKGGSEAALREDAARKGALVSKVRTAVAEAVDMILKGEAEEVTRLVRVRMIPKPKGGSRPLGIGETLAKVAKTIATRALVGRLGGSLAAVGQYALEVDGAHKVARAMQAEFDKGRVLVAVDVRSPTRTPSAGCPSRRS